MVNEPSREYLEESLKITERQITIGGYRLAKVLTDIYKTRNTIEIHESQQEMAPVNTEKKPNSFL